jgi:hypothetical protein
MASKTSPPIPKPLWQHPLFGQPGGPSFGIAEAARRTRTWTQREYLVRQAHQRVRELDTVRRKEDWEFLPDAVRREKEATYEAARADLFAAQYHVYPTDFQEAFKALWEGRSADPTPLISFLEADPYFRNSGYMKEDVLRLLKRCELTPTQAERLRGVILHIIERPAWRREFRYYGRLARKIDSPAFRATLQEFAESGSLRERERATWILAAMNS